MPAALAQLDPTRRSVLSSAMAGVAGLGLSELLVRRSLAEQAGHLSRARNVLVLYEEGGISQMDTWDPKPEAPVDHRSPYAPISTSVAGMQFSSLMPNIARHADKLSVVRSMTSTPVLVTLRGASNS